MVYLLVGLFRRPIENYRILKMTKLASEYGVEENNKDYYANEGKNCS